MDYKEFKKEYNKIIKRIDSEINIVLAEIKSQGGDINQEVYTYPIEYKKFKRIYLNNESENPKKFLQELYGIHTSILDSDTVQLFLKNGYVKRHFVSGINPNLELMIGNCYNDKLRFSFYSVGNHSQQTYEAPFIITPNDIKFDAGSGSWRPAIDVIKELAKNGEKRTGLNISCEAIGKYVKQEVIKLYFNPLMEELSPKIKNIYDICNNFNFEEYDMLFRSNDIHFSIKLNQSNEMIQEEINQIKDVINISTDFSTEKKINLNFNNQKEILDVFTLKSVKTLYNDLKVLNTTSLTKKLK